MSHSLPGDLRYGAAEMTVFRNYFAAFFGMMNQIGLRKGDYCTKFSLQFEPILLPCSSALQGTLLSELPLGVQPHCRALQPINALVTGLQVNRLELTLSIGSFAAGLGAMIAGIFGMNLTSTFEASVIGFWGTTAFIVFGCILIVWALYSYTRRRRIL